MYARERIELKYFARLNHYTNIYNRKKNMQISRVCYLLALFQIFATREAHEPRVVVTAGGRKSDDRGYDFDPVRPRPVRSSLLSSKRDDDNDDGDDDDGDSSRKQQRNFRPMETVGTGNENKSFYLFDSDDSRRESNVWSANGIVEKARGIYVDFIYNPNFYYELSVVKYMIEDILFYNNQTPFYYDDRRDRNSVKVTVGVENAILLEESVITIKPKLLKDVLYNENIFLRTYDFIYAFFQVSVKDHSRIPEYDRYINFKVYSRLFRDALAAIDDKSQTICRHDDLYGSYGGRLCVRADHEYIDRLNFTDEGTRRYWKTLLDRISSFMNMLLGDVIFVDASERHDKGDCYEIELRPEPNVRSVLLYPHRASREIRLDEVLRFDDEHKDRIRSDIILFKHRILHALGVGHKYVKPSVMNFYDRPWQRANLFFIMPEDYTSLSQCYVEPKNRLVPSHRRFHLSVPKTEIRTRYVKGLGNVNESERLLGMFVNDFARFSHAFRTMIAVGNGGKRYRNR